LCIKTFIFGVKIHLDVILHQENQNLKQMKKKILMLAMAVIIAQVAVTSCGWNVGLGDKRDRNIESATLNYLDSIPDVEYIGLADTHDLDNGQFQAVVIYNVRDSAGNKTERNARVTTNGDGSEIITWWEDLNCSVLSETKQKITDKMEEKGIPLDGSLIDALIKIKRGK